MSEREVIRSHRDLQVYQRSFRAAMEIFQLTRSFPRDEIFSLTSQIRRSSRSVNMNLAEAWRKRRYPAAFVAKLSDAESEAAETQTSIEFALACAYIDEGTAGRLSDEYEQLLRMIVSMINAPEKWTIPTR
jgi:four helix bundle protein